MASEASTFTTPVAETPLSARFGSPWRLALLAATALVGLLGLTLGTSLAWGVGLWGINVPFV